MQLNDFAQYYLFALIVLVPVVQIFDRAGFRPAWAVLLAVPGFGFILCAAVLALKKWPQGVES
jgi:hypothetical protein